MITLDARRSAEVQVRAAAAVSATPRALHASQRVMQRLLQRLEARERELRASIADERCRVETEELPQLRESPGDEVDRAFIVSQVGIDRSRVDRFAREIEAIVAMRERIGRGAGGICVGCGEAIGAARLLANPVADRCTDCQAAIEWAARSRGR